MKDLYDDVFSSEEYEKDEWDVVFEEVEKEYQANKKEKIDPLFKERENGKFLIDKMKNILAQGITYQTHKEFRKLFFPKDQEVSWNGLTITLPGFVNEFHALCENNALNEKIFKEFIRLYKKVNGKESVYSLCQRQIQYLKGKREVAPDSPERSFVWWRYLLEMGAVALLTFEYGIYSLVACAIVTINYHLYKWFHKTYRHYPALFLSCLLCAIVSLFICDQVNEIILFLYYIDFLFYVGIRMILMIGRFSFRQVRKKYTLKERMKKSHLYKYAFFICIALYILTVILAVNYNEYLFMLNFFATGFGLYYVFMMARFIELRRCEKYLKQNGCIELIDTLSLEEIEGIRSNSLYHNDKIFYLVREGVVLPFSHVKKVERRGDKDKIYIHILTNSGKIFTFPEPQQDVASYMYQILGRNNPNIEWDF